MGPDVFPLRLAIVLSLTSMGEESDFPKELVITTAMKAVFRSSTQNHSLLCYILPVSSNIPSVFFFFKWINKNKIPVFSFDTKEMVYLKNVISISIKKVEIIPRQEIIYAMDGSCKRRFVVYLFCKKVFAQFWKCLFKLDSLPWKNEGHGVFTSNFCLVLYYPLYNTTFYNISL